MQTRRLVGAVVPSLSDVRLCTRFCGFKIMVMAYRLECENALAHRAHDRLVAKLCQLFDLMREALAAERYACSDSLDYAWTLIRCRTRS